MTFGLRETNAGVERWSKKRLETYGMRDVSASRYWCGLCRRISRASDSRRRSSVRFCQAAPSRGPNTFPAEVRRFQALSAASSSYSEYPNV